MCKISIVLPTYNGERWLELAIKSIINQTETNWELIIVNDCSIDRTLEIATHYSKKDNRIRVITNSTNKKLPASLNIGFSVSCGKYLTWTSDDNILKSTMLEKLSSYLDNHNDIDLISMNFDIINEEGEILREFEEQFAFQRNTASLLLGCNVGAAFMYRKQIAEEVGMYDTALFCAEDFDYWCRIALRGKIAYSNDNVYQYRINQYSLSSTKKQEVKQKTLLIKLKYSNSFFDKFNYSYLDKSRFWLRTSWASTPIKYIPTTLLLLFIKAIIKSITIPLLFNKKIYKRTRNSIGIDKTFSFQILKKISTK